MPTVKLPRSCDVATLVQALGDAGALREDWDSLVIYFEEKCFIDPAAAAYLCTWCLAQKGKQKRLLLRGDPDAIGYLARMDFQEHLGMEYEKKGRKTSIGRFLPLRLIGNDSDAYDVVMEMCDLITHQFDNARLFVPAFEWASFEIIHNIVTHSEAPVPGAVMAQYFPNKNRLDLAVCDVGRGILSSLSESYPLTGHGHAISTALKRGVTRNQNVGAGNGLSGSLDIMRWNDGGLDIWTGDVCYRVKDGRERGFTRIPQAPGTGVMFSFNTNRPVDLHQTWLACADEGVYFVTAAVKVEKAGGLLVREECENTFARPPAERLRRKILSILPELEGPLVLDFDGVERASGSFLDELLGRLALTMGKESFKERIGFVNMSMLLRDLAYVQIAQRVDRVGVEAAVLPEEWEEPF